MQNCGVATSNHRVKAWDESSHWTWLNFNDEKIGNEKIGSAVDNRVEVCRVEGFERAIDMETANWEVRIHYNYLSVDMF